MNAAAHRVRLLLLALAVAAVGGCEKTARNMYAQPRNDPLAPSTLWADTRSARDPPAGGIAHSAGTRAATSSGREGAEMPEETTTGATAASEGASGAGSAVAQVPAMADVAQRNTWTLAVLARGRERYDIFCAPCHSITGDGDGMIVRRGFPRPPSLHLARLVDAADSHYYAVITDGFGAMYPYANRVPPDDRRAIIAYIRALQLGRHARVADASAATQARLRALP